MTAPDGTPRIREEHLQSPDAEKALLGCVAFHADAIASVLADLPGEAFYLPARGQVWDACRKLAAIQEPINPMTVGRKLTADDQWSNTTRRVVQIEMLEATSPVFAARHAATVADLHQRRVMLRTVERVRQIVTEHPGDATEALVQARDVFDTLGSDDEARLGGTLNWHELLDEFEAAHAPDAHRACIPTPWPELDTYLDGLFGGRMYTIGGAPGDGKSACALNIAWHAATHNHPVLVFSKEMPTLDVTGRLVARGAEINLASINGRRLNDFDRAQVRNLRRTHPTLPLRVNADPVTITGVKQMARVLRHRGQLDLLVVDYLQLMTGDKVGRSAEEEIARVSTELKTLAMELDIPVVVPAQLNREATKRGDGRPTKADLRGSGRIEQDSDVVILLWRAPVKDDQTFIVSPDPHNLTLIVDKNRHGQKADVVLRWNGGYGRVG